MLVVAGAWKFIESYSVLRYKTSAEDRLKKGQVLPKIFQKRGWWARNGLNTSEITTSKWVLTCHRLCFLTYLLFLMSNFLWVFCIMLRYIASIPLQCWYHNPAVYYFKKWDGWGSGMSARREAPSRLTGWRLTIQILISITMGQRLTSAMFLFVRGDLQSWKSNLAFHSERFSFMTWSGSPPSISVREAFYIVFGMTYHSTIHRSHLTDPQQWPIAPLSARQRMPEIVSRKSWMWTDNKLIKSKVMYIVLSDNLYCSLVN